MSKALSQFRPGVKVSITCYYESCEDILIPVVLGKEDYIHPSFTGNGRFHWPPNTPVSSFKLSEFCKCPKCGTLFVSAIIVSNGRGRRPTLFGYDSEPA